MVRGLFSHFLIKAILVALLGLVLYGIFPGTGLAVILLLLVGMRLASLGAEALRRPMSAAAWEAMLDRLTRTYEKAAARQPAQTGAVHGQPPRLSPRELAQAQLDRARLSYKPPRSRWELGAETLGVVAFAILIPLDIALYTRDFFSLRTPQGWEGAGVAAVCVALYAWPHVWSKSAGYSDLRIWWWAIPFVVALPLLQHLVAARHPYLNPFDPHHNRLAAERVLALKNNIIAGRHADWVLRYARELDEQGAGPSGALLPGGAALGPRQPQGLRAAGQSRGRVPRQHRGTTAQRRPGNLRTLLDGRHACDQAPAAPDRLPTGTGRGVHGHAGRCRRGAG